MLSLIACVKHRSTSGSRYYVVSLEDKLVVRELKSSIVLKVGEVADIVVNSTGEIESAAIIEGVDAEKYVEKVKKAVVVAAKGLVKEKPYKKGIEQLDKITLKMWKKLEGCAILLLTKLMLGAPIVIRFHNDADGSSGAYSLYKSVESLNGKHMQYDGNLSWIMHPGVFYYASDASYDELVANNYASIEKPLLVIIDFGTSPDSNGGIRALEGKFDILWLDHHPLIEEFEGTKLEHYVNPWQYGGDSNYTAGYLTSVFAKTFSKVNTELFENASFVGDYSEYAQVEKESVDIAMILDLLTSDTRIGSGSFSNKISPNEIENILNDKVRRAELLSYAQTKLNDILDAGLDAVKRYKTDGGEIYVLDFEKVRNEESKYPLPGRYASKLLDRVKEIYGPNVIVVVHVGAYISIRITKEIGDKIRLLDVISEIKNKYGSIVEGGGGHKCAGSIKLSDKNEKNTVLRELVSILKARISP